MLCTETSHLLRHSASAGSENGADEPSLATGDPQDVTQGSWASAGVLHPPLSDCTQPSLPLPLSFSFFSFFLFLFLPSFGAFVQPQAFPFPGHHKAPTISLWGEVWCGLLAPRACRAELRTGTSAWLRSHSFLWPSARGTDDFSQHCGGQICLMFESARFPSAALKNCSSLWFLQACLGPRVHRKDNPALKC